MADVVLDHLEKLYDNGFHAVKDLSLDIEDGEFLVLVGPSGCGKSTALRMVAGLEDISGGELRLGGKRMNEVPPRDRDILAPPPTAAPGQPVLPFPQPLQGPLPGTVAPPPKKPGGGGAIPNH